MPEIVELKLMNVLSNNRLKVLSRVVCCIGLALVAVQTGHAESGPFGMYNNAPRVGQKIVPYTGSVVCKNRDDAIEMAKTGFFTPSCVALSPDTRWVVETRDLIVTGPNEEFVWMLSTTVDEEKVWIPIPWHDWNS